MIDVYRQLLTESMSRTLFCWAVRLPQAESLSSVRWVAQVLCEPAGGWEAG